MNANDFPHLSFRKPTRSNAQSCRASRRRSIALDYRFGREDGNGNSEAHRIRQSSRILRRIFEFVLHLKERSSEAPHPDESIDPTEQHRQRVIDASQYKQNCDSRGDLGSTWISDYSRTTYLEHETLSNLSIRSVRYTPKSWETMPEFLRANSHVSCESEDSQSGLNSVQLNDGLCRHLKLSDRGEEVHDGTVLSLSKREPKRTKPTPQKDRWTRPSVAIPGRGQRTVRKVASSVWKQQIKSSTVPALVPPSNRDVASTHVLETGDDQTFHSHGVQLQDSSKGTRTEKLLFQYHDQRKHLQLPSRKTQIGAIRFSSVGTQTDPFQFSSVETQTDPTQFFSAGTQKKQTPGFHEPHYWQMPFKDAQAPGHPKSPLDGYGHLKDGFAPVLLSKKSSKHVRLEINPSLKGQRLGEYLDMIIQLQTSMIDKKGPEILKSSPKDLTINELKKTVKSNRAPKRLPFDNGNNNLRLIPSSRLRARPQWRRLRKKPRLSLSGQTDPFVIGSSGLENTKHPFVTEHQGPVEHIVDTSGNIELSYLQSSRLQMKQVSEGRRVAGRGDSAKLRVENLAVGSSSRNPSNVKNGRQSETLNSNSNEFKESSSQQRQSIESKSKTFYTGEELTSDAMNDGLYFRTWIPGPEDKRADGQPKLKRIKFSLRNRNTQIEWQKHRVYPRKIGRTGANFSSFYRHAEGKRQPKPNIRRQRMLRHNGTFRHAIYKHSNGSPLPSSPNGVPPPETVPNITKKQVTEPPPPKKTSGSAPETTNGAVPHDLPGQDSDDLGSDWEEEYPT